MKALSDRYADGEINGLIGELGTDEWTEEKRWIWNEWVGWSIKFRVIMNDSVVFTIAT